MFQEIQRVLETYWLFMVIKLAYNESAYVSSIDINIGVDTSGKYVWIEQEGWESLINVTNSLSDEEKLFLLNGTHFISEYCDYKC